MVFQDPISNIQVTILDWEKQPCHHNRLRKTMDEPKLEAGPREFDLLSRAASSAVLTVRDDQFEFPWLLDAAQTSRRHGGRFRLVDSGRSDAVSLCWLIESGAEVYSSDEARPDRSQVLSVALAGRKSGRPTFYYIHGPLAPDAAAGGAAGDTLALGDAGADIHLSNRVRPRAGGALLELARACRAGRGRFVYYHFGRLEPFLEELAAGGAWIHWPAEDLDSEAGYFLLGGILRSARASGGGLVLHLDRVWPPSRLRGLFDSGAFLEFHAPLGESSPDQRKFEAEASRRRPDFRAFYLHLEFLP
jgi:hypothetical protein